MLRAGLISIAIVLFFPPFILYLTLAERKILADMQGRLGPMRVGPHGLLQGVADAIKLLLKEDIVPSGADPIVFRFAPAMATATALAGLALIPFSSWAQVADLNIGLLLLLATASFGVLALVLGGWASNSHYALLGALRGAAQLISYEIALSLAAICAVLSAGTLRLGGIVAAQNARGVWFAFDHWGFGAVAFGVFVIAALAEGNRSPFDLPEAESELAGGYHLEYSGMRFAFFMLAEYANLLVACSLAVTLFLGGPLPPFANIQAFRWIGVSGGPALVFALIAAGVMWLALRDRRASALQPLYLAVLYSLVLLAGGLSALFLVPAAAAILSGIFWFLLKTLALVYGAIWIRATLPRLRYDQLLRLGWKWLIPVGVGAVALNAIVGLL